MNVVVTGSESFIGRELRRRLRGDGADIVGIDAVPSREPGHVQADIRDPEVERAIPRGADALVHLAAVSTDKLCREDPRLAFDVNVGGTLNVVRAARARRVRQVIFASSEWVYGEVANTDVMTETSPIDAGRLASEYALTKLVGERLLANAVHRGLPAATVLRFGIVYGPRPSNWSAVESLFHAVRTQPRVEVGSLRTARRYVHVSDIAEGIRRSVGQGGFEVFNLTGDHLVTLRDVIDTSAALLGRQPQVVEREPASVSIRNPDNTKAKRQLGWTPVVDLKSGLATLLEA